MSREESVQHFLDLIKKSRRGKFKVYIGMIAGVGKSYRMLQEAHELLDNGVDVKIGYIETHGRAGTDAMLEGLPVVPRRKIFYKGKELEEMDLDAIIQIHPEIVVVDELAHTNVEGSRNAYFHIIHKSILSGRHYQCIRRRREWRSKTHTCPHCHSKQERNRANPDLYSTLQSNRCQQYRSSRITDKHSHQ